MKISSRVLKIADYPSANLTARKKKLQAEGKRLFDFGTGDPIEPTPPFIREAASSSIPVISQYPPVKGTPELRRSIQGYVKRRFGCDLDPETEILPCTGSKEAIYNVQFLLIEPGCEKNLIIGPTPGYFVMERSAVICGAEYYPFELNQGNGFLMELSTLPEAVLRRTAMAWINYPHNPTGVECDLDYLKRQVEICKKFDILLCSDECYVDLYFSNKPAPSVLEVTKEGVLAFHSCSKRSGMTAYRTGFVAGDRTMIDAFTAFRSTLGVAAPVYTQGAATAAWSDDAHVVERRGFFQAKRQLFLDFFRETGFKPVKSDATFYFWIETPKGFTGEQYATKLLELGIIASPGEFFGAQSSGYFRLALVPSLEDCKEAIRLWKTIL